MDMKQNADLAEQKLLFRNLLKWILLATIIGMIVGLLSTLFIKGLDYGIKIYTLNPYSLLLLPVAFFLIGYMRLKLFPKDEVDNTNKVIETIHQAKAVSLYSTFKSFLFPMLTIMVGGSAGKEAPCTDVGAGIGSFISRKLKFDTLERKRFMICGISAGFASVFGTPIAAALYSIEILFIRGSYATLLPAFVSALVAVEISSFLGINYFVHEIDLPSLLDFKLFGATIFAAIIFGFLCLSMITLFNYCKQLGKRSTLSLPLKASIAGIFLLLIGLSVGQSPLGLGTEVIDAAVSGTAMPWHTSLLKFITTTITLNFGGSGGAVTPLLYIGATLGSFYASILQLPISFFAAIGIACVLASVINTPFAAAVLSIELFGPEIAPYVGFACLISFLITGQRSIFPSQFFEK